jgi:uncharacterized protein YodC (DUF2158 family)
MTVRVIVEPWVYCHWFDGQQMQFRTLLQDDLIPYVPPPFPES